MNEIHATQDTSAELAQLAKELRQQAAEMIALLQEIREQLHNPQLRAAGDGPA